MGIAWGRAAQLHPKAHPTIPRASSPQSQLPEQDPHSPLGSSLGILHVQAGKSSSLCSASPQGSIQNSIPGDGGCPKRPQGGCSARGDNDSRCHLLIPGGKSLHGNVCPCHCVALPGAPVRGRGASVTFQGLEKHRNVGKLIPGGFGFDGSYFLLQQQAVRIPVASSTRNPEGWKQTE